MGLRARFSFKVINTIVPSCVGVPVLLLVNSLLALENFRLFPLTAVETWAISGGGYK
jgi:hypothetical protein